MLQLRKAAPDDLDFLVATDLGVDIEDAPGEPLYMDHWSDAERVGHRAKILSFIVDPNKTALVIEETDVRLPVGMLLGLFRDRRHEPHSEEYDFLFRFIDESVLPPDGQFAEVFQLWVHPAYRRRGLATDLKNQFEREARGRGIHMLYTHTRERNAGVIALNHKLGYTDIRCGPMWDDTVRVSMVKALDAMPGISGI